MAAAKTLRVIFLFVAAEFLLCLAPVAQAVDPNDAQRLYRQNLTGTAFVRVNDGSGSGWLIDRERRLLVTNSHVIANDDEPLVYFPEVRDGRLVADRLHYDRTTDYLRGKVVLKDKTSDLAIIQLPRLPAGVAALTLAPNEAVPGQRVHAIGNPGASPALWVYSTGTVRAVVTAPKDWKDWPGVRIVMTQIPLNFGDSGGPMFDDEGRVLGVSTAGVAKAQLISFAIDVREVRGLYSRWLREAPIERNADLSGRRLTGLISTK